MTDYVCIQLWYRHFEGLAEVGGGGGVGMLNFLN